MHSNDLDNERLQQGCMNVLITINEVGYEVFPGVIHSFIEESSSYEVFPVIHSFIEKSCNDPSIVHLGLPKANQGWMISSNLTMISSHSLLLAYFGMRLIWWIQQVYAMMHFVEEYTRCKGYDCHDTLNEPPVPHVFLEAMQTIPITWMWCKK
jgi:hypothetical protein